MIQRFCLFLLLLGLSSPTFSQMMEEFLWFNFEDVSLHGVLNMPESGAPKGIVLIVHGPGRTDAINQNLHGDIRQTLVQAGYATYMWDKMGSGKSEGPFDYNQPVQNSAEEVLAAIDMLKTKEIPGSEEMRRAITTSKKVS